MAIITVTRTEHIGEAGRSPFIDVVAVTGAASYTTTGDTGLLACLLALTGDAREIIAAVQMAGAGYHAEYTVATDKLLVRGDGAAEKGAGTEVDAATNLSGVTFRFLVVSQ